jgi:hypothetical protein
VLRNYQDREFSGSNRRYWCFPHFKEEIDEGDEQDHDLERSVTPNRTSEVMIDNETIEDYVKFPDPWLYLIGFICPNTSPVREEQFHSKVSVKNT